MTSSKMSTASWARVSSRRPSRKPARGGTTPMLPATGSTMTAAISRPRSRKSVRTASRSLNGAVSVSCASGPGTPALSGIEKVAPPEPALTRRLSA